MQDLSYNKKQMGNMFKSTPQLICGTEYSGRRCFSNTNTENYLHSSLFFNGQWLQRPSNRAGVRQINSPYPDSNRYKLKIKETQPRTVFQKEPTYYNSSL